MGLADSQPIVAAPNGFCPRCRRSVWFLRVLDGRAGCRQCLKLDYASRHQDRADPFRLAVRLRRKLGAHPSLLEPLPPSPKDRRAAREYDRLASAIAVAEARALAWLRAFNRVLEKRDMADDGGELVPDDQEHRDQQLFQARLSGLTDYATAKRFGVKVSEVRRAVERLAPGRQPATNARAGGRARPNSTSSARCFSRWPSPRRTPQAAAICLKVSERKSSMLGLDYAPLRTDLATLTVIQPPPRTDSTALIRAALERVCSEGRPPPTA